METLFLETKVTIRTEQDVIEARKRVREMAKSLEFGMVDQVKITTAVSEIAGNICLYAGHGQVSFESVQEYNRSGIIIYAMDEGPGIHDIRKVLEDGYSTSGGLGAGIPGVKRLIDEFTIESNLGKGTKIILKKWKNP